MYYHFVMYYHCIMYYHYDLAIGTEIYMLPVNFNLSIRKIVGYNNKILISNTHMEIGSEKNIKRAEDYHPKSRLLSHDWQNKHLAKFIDNPIQDHYKVRQS